MRLSLHRFPRESRVAAVVLAAALLQVGVLAAIGLKSTTERRQEIERELADRARPVVQNVVRQATNRVGDDEVRLQRELTSRDATPIWSRVRDAMDGHITRVFEIAYPIDSDGRLVDWRRPPYPVTPPGPPDEAARRRLAEVLGIERSDPARAVELARSLSDDLSKRTPCDAVAAALAEAAGWRAALSRNDYQSARTLAGALLERYPALRDDRGPMAESEPMGPAAAAVVCDVLYRTLTFAAAPGQAAAFVDAVVSRRVLAQRLRPVLSDPAYQVETAECERLRKDASLLPPDLRSELRNRLEECDELDRRQAVAQALGQRPLRDAAGAEFSSRFTLDGGALLTVIPLPRTRAERSGEPLGVAFVAAPSTLKAEAIDPAAHASVLPAGVVLVVRDAANHDLLQTTQGQALLDEAVSFGSAVPGLRANAVLVDASILERETTSARRLWLAILGGAGLAVVAASLLAVRAVLREVRLARMKSDFVSNLSHELRTPLTSLRMFVETLREGRVRDEAEAKECLDIVAQETERLQSLVERMLQFASFARGRAPIELKSGDAGEVARRAVAVFRKRAEAARAVLELSVEDPLPESILDRDAVLQVFLNLLDNAVKYAGHDGAKIRVAVRASGPAGAGGTDGAERGVLIEVEDDGPGVPEKERELVFEEFYRGDDTLSRRVEGTGIGLAVARRIVLAHGGRIEVTGSPSLGGASFRVTLPAAEVGRRLAFEASRGGRE